MKAKKEKVSTYQIMLLFIMITLSPAIRLFPTLTVKEAKQAAWLTPAVSAAAMIVLVLIVQSFFINPDNLNLSDIYMKVLGRIPGWIIIFVHLIYIVFLTGLYVRYYAERITSSIMPETRLEFFIFVMMCLVFYVLRGGLVPFVRTVEFLYYVFVLVLLVTGLLTLPSVELTNFLPISYLDIIPVLESTHVILSIWSYFIFIFFFADKVNDREHIKKLGTRAVIGAMVLATWIIFATLGVLGQSLTARTSLPYLLSVKQISVLGMLERLESVTVALWVAADFVIITFMSYVTICIIKSLFNFTSTKTLSSPLVLLLFVISLALARNRFELEKATRVLFIPLNLILGFGIPVLVFIIGKMRGIIGSPPKKDKKGNKQTTQEKQEA